MRFGLGKVLIAPFLLAFFVVKASATPCVAPPASAEAILQFQANPQALVVPSSDTRTVEATVRDLAGTDASLAATLVKVAQGASARFQTAIAAGLAQAAVACQTIDQNAALLIQQAVATVDDGNFQSAFAAVAGDLSTAAVEAATSAAVGSVGSIVIVNPNPGAPPTTNFSGGGSTTVFQITAAVTTIGTTTIGATPSTTTSAATPVSATR